jgi:hypothetical protein
MYEFVPPNFALPPRALANGVLVLDKSRFHKKMYDRKPFVIDFFACVELI